MRIGNTSRRGFIQVGGFAGLTFFGLDRFGAADENDNARDPDGSDRAHKILRVGMARPKSPLYPVSVCDQASLALAMHLGEHLCCSASIELRPFLATRWWPSEDDTLWTFEIRPNVAFHDGRILSAGDVAASITRTNEAVAARIVDALTVELRVASPDPHFPWTVSSLNHASIIVPAELTTGNSKPVGTGPLRLHDYHADQGAVFLPHQGYWGRSMLPPALRHLERIEFVIYPDMAEAYEAARRGDVDRYLLAPI